MKKAAVFWGKRAQVFRKSLSLPERAIRWLRMGAIASSGFWLGCGGQPSLPPEARSDCAAPTHITIKDIQSVVDWINAMEKPLTLPCFVESLPRPLKIHVAISDFSAQPSPGRRSPRVFLFFNELILTVAVDQDFDEQEHPLLEMSYLVDNNNLLTTKGEIKFPITTYLPDSAPYTGFMFNDTLTSCAVCHAQETVYGSVEGVPIYQSAMLKPTFSIPVTELVSQHSNCDIAAEPHRCAMLKSIVVPGDLIPKNFPANAATIFDN